MKALLKLLGFIDTLHKDQAREQFLTLWDECKGTKEYDKKAWMRVQEQLTSADII